MIRRMNVGPAHGVRLLRKLNDDDFPIRGRVGEFVAAVVDAVEERYAFRELIAKFLELLVCAARYSVGFGIGGECNRKTRAGHGDALHFVQGQLAEWRTAEADVAG